MAATYSKELRDALIGFVVEEIGGKALEGITYQLIRDGDSKIEEYREIRKEANLCKIPNDKVFRVYKVQNGVIFDADMSIVTDIAKKLTQKIVDSDGNRIDYDKVIGNKPEMRRETEMARLTEYIQQEYTNGNTILEVALFSRSSVPEIVINGQIQKDKYAIQTYKAYAIRYWDLENLNRNYLIPIGFKIKQVAAGQILPACNGVIFQLEIEKLGEC